MNKKTVFIHGFLGTGAMWGELATDGHLTLSLPGHDTRRHPENSVDCELSYQAALEWAIERLPDEPLCLVGYSMGARLALGLALELPHRVGELFLIGVNPGIEDASEKESRLEWEGELALKLEQGTMESFVDMWERLPIFDTQKKLPQEAIEKQRQMRLRHDPGQLAMGLRMLGLSSMPNLWERLGEIVAPVTYITGELDEKFGAMAGRAAQMSFNAQHIVIPGCGHNCMLERPQKVHALWGLNPGS